MGKAGIGEGDSGRSVVKQAERWINRENKSVKNGILKMQSP